MFKTSEQKIEELKEQVKIAKQLEGEISSQTLTNPHNLDPLPENATRYKIYSNKKKYKWKNIKEFLKDRFGVARIVLINMELINGTHRLFTVLEKDNGFKFKDKQYVFDQQCKYYCTDAMLWCFDFHEECTLPIKRRIPISDIKKTAENSAITDIEYMLNPTTLKRFTISKIAEGIMAGQQIDIFLRKMFVLIIIAVIASVGHLLLFVIKSGMLQQINIPGIS